MGRMYFAKMNINEDIYKVYEGKEKISNLISQIFLGITPEPVIHDEFGGRYKFFNLDSSQDIMAITGNLGYIKKGVHSSYDPETDEAIDVVDKNKIEYITFYFDVEHEVLAYMTLPVLQRNKVLGIFSKLIKESVDIGVEFVQESNLDNLKDELSKFNHLSKMEVKLVPPNGDKEDFAELSSLTVEKVQKGNATQIQQIFKTQSDKGLIMESELVQNTLKSVGLGYAEVKFSGKDKSEEKIEVSSKKNTPYTKFVPSDASKSHSVVSEKGRAGIENILEYKTRLRIKNERSKKSDK